MDDLKMQKQTLKKAYKKTKRKHITPWKILAIICAVMTIVSIPLSIFLQKFDNTMAARFGGSFWKLENEDTNAQYYTSDFNSAEEMGQLRSDFDPAGRGRGRCPADEQQQCAASGFRR